VTVLQRRETDRAEIEKMGAFLSRGDALVPADVQKVSPGSFDVAPLSVVAPVLHQCLPCPAHTRRLLLPDCLLIVYRCTAHTLAAFSSLTVRSWYTGVPALAASSSLTMCSQCTSVPRPHGTARSLLTRTTPELNS
jgi:hypothetical protein